MEILVCTISDRAARCEYRDESGPRIESLLRESLPAAAIRRTIISDEPDELRKVLRKSDGVDVILTTGGTGLGPRDNAPDVTLEVCDRQVPGIAELLRLRSLEQTANAALSRGAAGMLGRTLVVNLPGSVRASDFCTRQLLPLLPHAVKMSAGAGH